MGLSCGMNFLKILLFIFNFIFWLLGVAVLAVGIWSRVDGASWETFLRDSTILNSANLMIASGVIVAVIGFLGCCGAIKKSECMLISYAILIFLIFVLEIGAGIYAYTKEDAVQKDLVYNLKEAIHVSYESGKKSDEVWTKAVDLFQQTLKCCGTEKPEDWKESKWYKNSTELVKNEVPASCCINKAADCNKGTVKSLKDDKKIFTNGCVVEAKNLVKNHLWKIGGVAVGIGIIQLFGIVFAICLCRAIRQEEGGSSA